MRIVDAVEYPEQRDALSRDWSVFMPKVLPEAGWVPIPNIGKDVIAFADQWRLNGFILTGGDDLFAKPIRDETEHHIITHALNHDLPVLGVCRGMQLIASFFGAGLARCANGCHCHNQHAVHLTGEFFSWPDTPVTVNSFHTQCLFVGKRLRRTLKPFALSPDGSVEGFIHQDQKLMGVMWHPERLSPSAALDRCLIRSFFEQREECH